MSLVNDLLIEAERKRSGARPTRTLRLDDLVPTRRRASRAGPAIGLGAVGVALALFASIAIGLRLGHDLRSHDLVAGARSAVAAVAAKRVSTELGLDSQNVPTHATTLRPVRVEAVELERVPTLTRLRIRTDARTTHRFTHDATQGRLDLVLESASLVEPSAPFALLDTPIRALDLRAEGSDVSFTLTLDPEVRSQLRWLELTQGAVLLLELKSPPSVAAAGAIAGDSSTAAGDAGDPLAAVEMAEPEEIGLATALPAEEPAREPAAAAPIPASPAPIEELTSEELDPEELGFEELGFAGADRSIEPGLGDPATLRIERSHRDRVREAEAERARTLAQTIAAARRARDEERLVEADALYAEAVLIAPRQAGVIVEWSELLFEQGRATEAIELVERARSEAPRNGPLLMAHARLLERQGALDRAIGLLEQSRLAVTEAPDVHALVAAYHQRAGDHAAALDRYEAVLRRFPEEPRNWMGLGISLEALGRSTEARDVYRIALQVGDLPGGTRRWVMDRLAALGRKD